MCSGIRSCISGKTVHSRQLKVERAEDPPLDGCGCAVSVFFVRPMRGADQSTSWARGRRLGAVYDLRGNAVDMSAAVAGGLKPVPTKSPNTQPIDHSRSRYFAQ